MKSRLKTAPVASSSVQEEKLDTRAEVRRKITTFEFLNGGISEDCGGQGSLDVNAAQSKDFHPGNCARKGKLTGISKKKCDDMPMSKSSDAISAPKKPRKKRLTKEDDSENTCVEPKGIKEGFEHDTSQQVEKEHDTSAHVSKKTRGRTRGKKTVVLNDSSDNSAPKDSCFKSGDRVKRTRKQKVKLAPSTSCTKLPLCDKELVVVLEEHCKSLFARPCVMLADSTMSCSKADNGDSTATCSDGDNTDCTIPRSAADNNSITPCSVEDKTGSTTPSSDIDKTDSTTLCSKKDKNDSTTPRSETNNTDSTMPSSDIDKTDSPTLCSKKDKTDSTTPRFETNNTDSTMPCSEKDKTDSTTSSYEKDKTDSTTPCSKEDKKHVRLVSGKDCKYGDQTSSVYYKSVDENELNAELASVVKPREEQITKDNDVRQNKRCKSKRRAKKLVIDLPDATADMAEKEQVNEDYEMMNAEVVLVDESKVESLTEESYDQRQTRVQTGARYKCMKENELNAERCPVVKPREEPATRDIHVMQHSRRQNKKGAKRLVVDLSDAITDMADKEKVKEDYEMSNAEVLLLDETELHAQESFDPEEAENLSVSPQRDASASSLFMGEEPISPPNSPLYDMPPPSTRSQKQARRLKRKMQLENNRKYEESLAREERMRKRLKLCDESEQVLDRRKKTVSWKMDLVSVHEIDMDSDLDF